MELKELEEQLYKEVGRLRLVEKTTHEKEKEWRQVNAKDIDLIRQWKNAHNKASFAKQREELTKKLNNDKEQFMSGHYQLLKEQKHKVKTLQKQKWELLHPHS